MNKGIQFGLYVAGCTVVLSLLQFVTGLDESPSATYFGYLSMVILGIGIWMAQKARKADQGGMLTYGQGVGTGALVGLTAGFVGAVFMLVYTNWINPDLIDVIRERVESEMMANPDMSEQQREAAISMTQGMMTPTGMALQSFFATGLAGLIIALIMTIFTRSKNDANVSTIAVS